MRQALQQTFSEIFILDLHGNAKKKETAPDGGLDQNVFDIQQGVAIGIFVKQPGKSGPAKMYHADLWGTRENKYAQLFEQDIAITDWAAIKPQPPFYLFVPQNVDLLGEYNQGWKVTDIFPLYSVGIVTGQDNKTIGFNQSEATKLAETLELTSNSVTRILYRPFDERFVVYEPQVVTRNRFEVMQHFLNKENLGLIFMRQVALHDTYSHFGASRALVDNRAFYSNKGIMSYAPLYLYPTDDRRKQTSMFDISLWPPDMGKGSRVPNLAPAFVDEVGQKLGLTFQPFQTSEVGGQKSLETSAVFTPEDIFHYIYAVFHCPTYRSRYAEFLKIDFPRVPLTAGVVLFRALCALGQELVGLHLLESPAVNQFITRYPMAGDNTIAKGYPKYTPPKGEQAGRVYINQAQFFEGIAPDLWAFHIGGYQVLEKWLKDRRGRLLSYEELTHYQQTAVALHRTMALMEKIDEVIMSADWFNLED